MPYRFLHSKRLKSKVLIVAEAYKIAKQMRGEETPIFFIAFEAIEGSGATSLRGLRKLSLLY
jgi:hypothetical protein